MAETPFNSNQINSWHSVATVFILYTFAEDWKFDLIA